MSATAFIEFIGIVLVLNPMAITTSTSTAKISSTPAPTVVAIIPPMPDGVTPHTPMIVFPKADLAPNVATAPNPVNWDVSDLRDGLAWVPLTKGDQITFEDLPTQPLTVDLQTPHLRKALEHDNTGGNIQLQPGYNETSNFSSAVAIVKMTRGAVSGCSPVGHEGRVDTLVTLNTNTNGALTIKTATRVLRLILHDRDVVNIVNVPFGYAMDPSTAAGNHYLGFCAMATNVETCLPPPVPKLMQCPFNPAMIVIPVPGGGHTRPDATSATVTTARMITPAIEPMTHPAPARESAARPQPSASAKPSSNVTQVSGKANTPSVRHVSPPNEQTLVAKSTPTGFAGSADCSNTQWP